MGFVQLYGQYYKVKKQELELISSSLDMELTSAIALRQLSQSDIDIVQPAIQLLSSEDAKAWLHKSNPTLFKLFLFYLLFKCDLSGSGDEQKKVKNKDGGDEPVSGVPSEFLIN